MNPEVDQLFFIDTRKSTSDEQAASSFDIITCDDPIDEPSSPSSERRDFSDKAGVVLGYDEEEAELEHLVFGGRPEAIFEEDDDEERSKEEINSRPDSEDIQSSQQDDVDDLLAVAKKRKPAWIDEDDESLKIDIKDTKRLRKLRKTDKDSEIDGSEFSNRLRTQFEKLVGAPEWAKRETRASESDEDDDFLRSARKYLGKCDLLPQAHIAIRKVKDANISKRSDASVHCLEFHPFSKVVLTAGMNKTLNIFQIDGESNPSIQNLFLEGFPIHTAHFTPDGQQVVISSRRKHFFILDMTSAQVKKIPRIQGRTEKSLERFVICPDGSCIAFLGESGYINLVSLKTTQFICSLKMNGSVKCAAFSSDGARLFSFGGDGEVYVWDMKTKKCKHKFRDEGCLKGTCIDVSNNGKYVACGSNSGVVNLYDESCFSLRDPKPVKTVMNLTTSIHCVRFNPTSEILAIASRSVKDSFRLLHIQSLTVFANWPTRKGTLGYVQSVTFSPKSGYLGIGSDSGKAMLFRLRHYPDG